MAGRLPKKGISFAGWSTDIFDNDTKIDKLLDAYGWDGFGIYFYLCQRAYGGDGYFYRWGYADCATTARKMGGGIGSGTVHETVGYCLQIGLFDKGLFDRWGILTSRGIQKRYIEVIKTRDVKNVIADYWLLRNEENCKGLLKLPLNINLDEENSDFPQGNSNFQQEKDHFDAQKESKVNKSKNIYCPADAERVITNVIRKLNELTDKCFQPDTKQAVRLITKLLKKGYAEEQLLKVVEKKCAEWKGTDYEQYLRPSTLFGDRFDEYLNQKQAKKKGATKFHNFEQHEYDFKELDDKLFIN